MPGNFSEEFVADAAAAIFRVEGRLYSEDGGQKMSDVTY
jgi:hypothetical protein